MPHSIISHTLNIFERMYRLLGAHVPQDIVDDLKHDLDDLKQRTEVLLEDVETTMVKHGKRVWPYIRAFEDMYVYYEAGMLEKLLYQRASQGLKVKLQLFREMDGDMHDIYSGSVHHIFESDERQELMALLVDLKHDIRKHATQKILLHDKQQYNEKVAYYADMLEQINNVLEDVRKFAHEEAHEFIAENIHEKIKTVEHSFAFLAPPVDIVEVLNLADDYRGKQEEFFIKRLHVK